MDDKLFTLLKFLKELWKNKWTGQLRLNFHKGNLSEKVEKKESVKLDDVMLTCARIKRDEIIKDILDSPLAKGKNDRRNIR